MYLCAYTVKSLNHEESNNIFFLLIRTDTAAIDLPYALSTYEVKNILKRHKATWSQQDKLWAFPKGEYGSVLGEMESYFKEQKHKVILHPISKMVYEAEKPLEHQLQIRNGKCAVTTVIKYSGLEVQIDPKSLSFYDRLYDFQKEAVQFGINKHGRLLLADEMGVGKTIQSLAIASIYRHEWPLLIITPSTLKLNWQQEVFAWLDLKRTEVQIQSKSGAPIREGIKVLIISYDIAWKVVQCLEMFKVVITDEAHYLKNQGNKRSDILVPFLSARKRIILLTGTPAFAKPREIYNLISIVRPDVFHQFKEFGYRYCEPKHNPWNRGMEYNGCKNAKELHYLLKDNIMIRRLKKDVLSELPQKQRQKIIIQTNRTITKQIKELLSSGEAKGSIEQMVIEMLHQSGSESNRGSREAVMEAYRLTGTAKVESVKEYIASLLENNAKILVFAHHQNMLNSLEEELVKQYKCVRIDGQVSQQMRHTRVQAFQEDPSVMVALLSITAAGVGITLTAASTVVFAELHWTPGMMLQAEDRAHRIGQKSSVNCHYLIGENTLDSILYGYLQKKVKDVSSFVEGKKETLQIEQLKKGEKGKMSRRDRIQPPKPKALLTTFVSMGAIIPHSQETEIESDLSCTSSKSRKRKPIHLGDISDDQQMESSEKRHAPPRQ